MRRSILGVVAALIAWMLLVTVAGLMLRVAWPAYAKVADAMTFTLPMMLARLAIGAVATLAAGYVVARIAPRSPLAGLAPGVILLVLFVPQHVRIWDRFPVWYHLTFLISLVPLTWAGGTLRVRVRTRAA